MPIGAVAEAVLIMASPLALEPLIVDSRLGLVLAHANEGRLRVAFLALLLREFVGGLHGIVGHEGSMTAHPAIHPLASLGHVLVAEGHDDAIVVLGVLQIVLRQHRIARGRGVARER
jgi:hypothetical protein